MHNFYKDLVFSVKLQFRKPLIQKLCYFPQNVVFKQGSSSIDGLLPSKDILHQRISSIDGHLQLKVIFKVVFCKGLVPSKGHLPSKIVFHQIPSFFKGCLPLKLVSHLGFSSIKGHHQKSFSI